MSASNSLTPRGPLPPGVYWRRRVVVLIGAAVLVFAIAHLLGGGSDGSSQRDAEARQAAAQVSASTTATSSAGMTSSAAAPVTTTPATPITSGTAAVTGATSSAPLTLAAPSGSCDPADITVTPQIPKAVAGSDVNIGFALQTKTSAACTWNLSSRSLAVKIVRGHKVLWTSQQCPTAVPNRSVVIRNVVPSLVTMVWNGHTSNAGCGRGTAAVQPVAPGRLTVWASTLGGEPGRGDGAMVTPAPATVTVAPKSSASGSAPTSAPYAKGEPRR